MRTVEYVKLALMFGVLTLFLLLVGFVLGYYVLGVPVQEVLIGMLGLSVAVNLFSYYYGPTLMLKMSRAKHVAPKEMPKLYSMLDELASTAGVSTPNLAIVNQPQPNAFTVSRGKNRSTIAVTTGLLSTMNDSELKAVLGHEVGHVVHRDSALATAAAALATAITYAVDLIFISLFFGSGRRGDGGFGIVGVIVAPIAASMVQLAISRGREYYADAESAKITGRPDYLVSALQKIEGFVRNGVRLNTPTTTSSLWIANPFPGGLSEIFSTHPATPKRIERLRKIGLEMGVVA